MPQRLKFIVAYDGAPFAGWQSQANGNGVQDHLERAFGAIAGAALRVHGAGRTDAGVHALAQCAHVDLAARSLPVEQWPLAVNAHLPPTIRILRAVCVPKRFHARYSAVGKIYRYRIVNSRVLPPLEFGRAWQVTAPIDRQLLAEAAHLFVGKHNFAGYAANRGKADENTVRTIESCRVRSRGANLELEFSGDGFLYRMVRLMVGAAIRCATGRGSIEDIRARLAEAGGGNAQPRYVAPAEGLFLVRVRY